MENKELLKKYVDLVIASRYPNDKGSMRKYFMNDIFGIVELSDGFISFDKESIKTRFCFGYDERSEGSIQNASDSCENLEYKSFLKENIYNIDFDLNTLNNSKDFVCIIGDNYSNGNNAFKYYKIRRTHEELVKLERLATQEEKDKIIKMLISKKENKIKRCEMWWKKYGKKNIRSWTYSVND